MKLRSFPAAAKRVSRQSPYQRLVLPGLSRICRRPSLRYPQERRSVSGSFRLSPRLSSLYARTAIYSSNTGQKERLLETYPQSMSSNLWFPEI